MNENIAGQLDILAVSDEELGYIYNAALGKRFRNVRLAISCGDLPFYYLEYIIDSLDVPLYFVRGNHYFKPEMGEQGRHHMPWGAIDLDQRCRRDVTGVLMAGIEGCLQYNYGPYQYTQFEMWIKVLNLVVPLIYNKARHGRYLDVFVTHAPAWHIHDADDRPHMGIKAFRWLDEVFKPMYHLHGHIHLYRQDIKRVTTLGKTQIVNCFGYREIQLILPAKKGWQRSKSKE
ncbi:MAG TPA: metallophosphoesterase [Longilinea sp.]|nr:metallophosphoesterase [Longilinea sp.]